MNNYNYEDDFFSGEYDKLAKNDQSKQTNASQGGWHVYGDSKPTPTPNAPKRKLGIAITCILMVVAFVSGFLLSNLFRPVTAESLLNDVITTIEQEFLWGDEITDAQSIAMIENAGTAMLQTLDRYSRLMSPQTAYDYFNPTAPGTATSQGYFGFSYQYSTFGLYVSQVLADSNAYGKLQAGDLIVHFANCQGNLGQMDDFSVSDYSQADLITQMSKVNSCTVSVLRNGDIVKLDLVRSPIGNGNNEFTMIEYYFGNSNTNLSTTPQNGAAISTVAERKLDQLPSNVGYIRLAEFEHYQTSLTKTVTAEQEFKLALDKFKASGKTKLIVDLKGNPGGYVTSACNIIGLLATTTDNSYLIGGKLLGCTLIDKNNSKETYTADRSYMLYDYYFGQQDGNTKDIVVWTDGNSASASELTLGAMLDYGTALQMGTTSFGKGIAQHSKKLNYMGVVTQTNGTQGVFNWYVCYTVAHYYSPNGTNIHGVGFTPSSQYNNLATYSQLVDAVNGYWR